MEADVPITAPAAGTALDSLMSAGAGAGDDKGRRRQLVRLRTGAGDLYPLSMHGRSEMKEMLSFTGFNTQLAAAVLLFHNLLVCMEKQLPPCCDMACDFCSPPYS